MILAFWVFVVLTGVCIVSLAYTLDGWVKGRIQFRYVLVHLSFLIIAYRLVGWAYEVVNMQDYLLR